MPEPQGPMSSPHPLRDNLRVVCAHWPSVSARFNLGTPICQVWDIFKVCVMLIASCVLLRSDCHLPTCV